MNTDKIVNEEKSGVWANQLSESRVGRREAGQGPYFNAHALDRGTLRVRRPRPPARAPATRLV